MKFLWYAPFAFGSLCLLGSMLAQWWWEVFTPYPHGTFPGANLALAIAGTFVAIGGVMAVIGTIVILH